MTLELRFVELSGLKWRCKHRSAVGGLGQLSGVHLSGRLDFLRAAAHWVLLSLGLARHTRSRSFHLKA